MKRFLFLLLFLTSSLAFAETVIVQTGATIPIKVTLQNMQSHNDYKDVLNGVSKIAGVTNLLPSLVAVGKATFTGNFTGDKSALFNDVQAFSTDRYKFEKKEPRGVLELILKKL